MFCSSNNSNKINYCSSSYLTSKSDKYVVGTKWSIIRPPNGIFPNQVEAALPMVWWRRLCTRLGNPYATGRAIFNRRRPPWSAKNMMWVVKQRLKTGGQKYRSVRYIFYMTILKSNQRFRTRIKLVATSYDYEFLFMKTCRYDIFNK